MRVTFADGSFGEYQNAHLGKGREGRIYRSEEGEAESAVKLYKPDAVRNQERIRRIDKLIHSSEFNPTIDNPYWAEFFAWPEKRVIGPGVGFRMRLVKGLETLNYYINDKNMQLKPQERGWLIGRIAVAIKLVTAANKLESMGLCYPDFSPGNILANLFTGQMVLVDCDSLFVRGSLNSNVTGTGWYQAPEIIKGDVKKPSSETDRHALAVILYSWLLLRHPLKGDKVFDLNSESDDQLRYGQAALYIEHPGDPSNRSTQQVLKAHMLGSELEKLFHKAFVDGLHDPGSRPYAYQWEAALYHTFDRIIPCASPYCDWRFFVVTDASRLQCPRCKQWLRNPETVPFIYFFPPTGTGTGTSLGNLYADTSNKHYMVGWPERYLHQWHIQPNDNMHRDPLYIPDDAPCAVFIYSKETRQWFLNNMTLPEMSYWKPTNSISTWTACPMMSFTPLETGMIFQFGKAATYAKAKVVLEGVR